MYIENKTLCKKAMVQNKNVHCQILAMKKKAKNDQNTPTEGVFPSDASFDQHVYFTTICNS